MIWLFLATYLLGAGQLWIIIHVLDPIYWLQHKAWWRWVMVLFWPLVVLIAFGVYGLMMVVQKDDLKGYVR